ncbi:MAG: hypothetical protein K2Y39_04610 [Candidatus Obscuribacterales bacterium]|nr:hypothetical protein [Candidatus Obscuribacterales bacterium]
MQNKLEQTSGVKSVTPETSLVEDFGKSLAHTIIQTPLDAIAQPIDRVMGSQLLPKLHLIDAPEKTEFGTSNYWAQQAGSAIGLLGTYWAAGKGVRAVMRAGQGEMVAATTLSRESQIGLSIKEAGVTGFVHDFALRPLEEGDSRNYIFARLSHGITGGATMATLAGVGIGLKQFTNFTPALKNDLAISVASAIPAGLVSANANSILKEGRLASGKENFESVANMAVIGAGLGARNQFRMRHKNDVNSSQPPEAMKFTGDKPKPTPPELNGNEPVVPGEGKPNLATLEKIVLTRPAALAGERTSLPSVRLPDTRGVETARESMQVKDLFNFEPSQVPLKATQRPVELQSAKSWEEMAEIINRQREQK